MSQKRWTRAEDIKLQWAWGISSIDSIAEKLGRTSGSVRVRAQRLKLGPQRRSRLSLSQASERLGYSRTAVAKEMRRIGMLPSRIGRRHGRHSTPHYAITAEQYDELEAAFRARPRVRYVPSPQGEWGTGSKPAACVSCGTTERPHESRGMCRHCYRRVLRAARARRRETRREVDRLIRIETEREMLYLNCVGAA